MKKDRNYANEPTAKSKYPIQTDSPLTFDNFAQSSSAMNMQYTRGNVIVLQISTHVWSDNRIFWVDLRQSATLQVFESY